MRQDAADTRDIFCTCLVTLLYDNQPMLAVRSFFPCQRPRKCAARHDAEEQKCAALAVWLPGFYPGFAGRSTTKRAMESLNIQARTHNITLTGYRAIKLLLNPAAPGDAEVQPQIRLAVFMRDRVGDGAARMRGCIRRCRMSCD